MNDQLAALALVIAEQRITIGGQAAELQKARAEMASLRAELDDAKKPAKRARSRTTD